MIDYSQELLDPVYGCTVCKGCMKFCENMYLRVPEFGFNNLIETLRAELVKRKIGPLPRQRVFGESIKENKNPYREPHGERFAWLTRDVEPTDNSDLLFYVGCTASYRQQGIAKSLIKVLQAAEVEFTVLGGEEWCCGSPLIRTGQLDIAEEVVEHNADAINAKGAKRVLVACAGCYSTLKRDYPDMGYNLGADVIHSSELLLELVKQGRIKLKKIDEQVTYHDPCHFTRDFEKYDTPRNLLSSIPGVRLVEMLRSKDQSWCCGAGGGVKAGYPEWSVEIAAERIREAKETGAAALITSCSFCKHGLQDGLKVSGEDIKLLDITEFIELALEPT